MQSGVLLLDPSGKILSLNQAARELLRSVEGLAAGDGMLTFTTLPSAEGDTLLQRRDGGPPLKVWVTPLSNGNPATSHLVVTLTPTALTQEERKKILVERFNLTAAEIRLAEKVLEGCNATRAAQSLGVTIHTVRTYLKRLYAKTGVCSQAGLVRILLRALE